jgi:YD repeat-containing protein
MSKSWRVLYLSVRAVLCCLLTSVLLAPEATYAADDRGIFPTQYTLSPTGVNLQTGLFVYSNMDISIGDLNFSRGWGDQSGLVRPNMKLFGSTLIANKLDYGWTHSLNQGTQAKALGNDTELQVNVEGVQYRFYVFGNGTASPKGSGSTGTNLRRVGNEYRFTDRAGAEYLFSINSAVSQEGFSFYPNQVLRETVRPDGTVLSYTYTAAGKLQEVRSSRGYAIHLDYDGNGNINQACGVNLATTFWISSSPCNAAALKTSYGYDAAGNLLTSVINVSGGQMQIQYAGTSISPGPTCLTLINSSVCAITNVYGSPTPPDCWSIKANQIARQITAAGSVWKYCFEPSPNPIDEPYVAGWPRWSYATMTEPDGFTHFLEYDRGRLVDDHTRTGTINYKYQGAVIKGTVATQTITFDYMETRPEMVTNPEGNPDYYIYNQRGAVMLVMHAPKGGQEPYLSDGSAALPSDIDLRRCCMKVGVLQAVPGSVSIGQAFLPDDATGTGCGAGAVDAKRCDKPIARIDERGYQTDYVYSQVHGGVETETLPAVGGIRPQKRFTYMQRYSWIKNSSGGYSPSGAAIWVLASQRQCRTSAATATGCSAAGDETVTTYEYGPDAGPNNLLLRGTAITADGTTVRTCYGYDWQGNRISTTAPRAALVSCP